MKHPRRRCPLCCHPNLALLLLLSRQCPSRSSHFNVPHCRQLCFSNLRTAIEPQIRISNSAAAGACARSTN